MSAKVLAELALKVWGVVLLLRAILAVPATLWMVWTLPSSDPQAAFMRASQLVSMVYLVAQAVAAVVVVVWADRIVALFEADESPLQIDITSAQLQILAFAIVGVFVLIDGFQNLAGAVYALLTKPAEVDAGSYMWERQGQGMIKAAVQISAGALLLVGRKTVAQGWTNLRGAGAASTADDDPDADDAGE